MNKIYKVMYSKVKQCAVVVSEIAKSHGHNGESSDVRKHAALTAAVLIALGSLSFTTAFVPMTAEAATKTGGSNFVGVERTDGLLDDKEYDNYGGKGANGADSITLGLRAKAGEGTITIGDRNAGASLGSVYVGQGDIAKPKLDTGGWVTSIGYNSDATGYGSIALGSNAVARNSYALDSKGESLDLNPNFRLNSKPDIQRASVAIGYGANADNGNIAIGSYSDASTDLRTAKTKDGKEINSYLTDTKADSYVSVGKTGALRRISNVADGAADSDAATIAQLKEAVKETDASKKANIDALNIGKNLKKADGKTAAESSDITANEDAWGTAIGTGSIANSNTNGSGQLVTGTTVYNYVSPKAVDGKELKYISEDKSTGTNLGILDDKVSTNATDITGLKSLSNITDNGKTVIKKAAVGAVKVTAGDRITVTPDSKNLTDADTVTYTISAKNDGKVASGNSGLVSGDTVYQALQNQTKSLTYNNGWGIIVDNSTKKISLNKNLTTKIIEGWRNDPSRLVEFKLDKTAMAIGGAIFNNSGSGNSYVDGLTMTINSDGPYSVSLGGINNSTKGRYSTVTGGAANVASGYASSVNGGKNNTASGKYATVIGGGYLWTEVYDNGDFPDVDNSIFGSYAYARNDASGDLSTVVGGHANKASGKQSLVAGGSNNSSNEESASVFGGADNIAAKWLTTVSGGLGNIAENNYSSIYGGIMNRAEGIASTASGGYYNIIASNGPIQPNEIWYGSQSSGRYGSAFGGAYNLVGGESGAAIGGGHSVVYGERSVGLAGGSTGLGAHYALAAGYQSVVTSKGSKLLTSDKHDEFTDDYHYDRYGYAHKITIKDANETAVDLMPEYVDVATAVGYQATANETNTVSFGHDVGDVSGYAVKWKERTDKDERGNINRNLDGSINDYTKVPDVIANHYDTAKYNRLVKVADGINNHDAVVMEQLRNADNVGKNAKNNVVVYKKNADGSLQVDEYGEAIVDDDASKAETEKATEQAIKDSGDAWGRALGTGKVEANNSQLVTGDTVYNAIQNQAEWKLTTNGESADKAAAIKPGTTVDFSAEKKGKDHSNVTISHEGSNVTIGLDKEIVLGDTTHGNGGSLNVYSDSSDGNNQSNHVSINGSTINVNYKNKAGNDTRGVILGVGKEDGKPDGYIAFNNVEGGYTYLHASTDASDDKKGRLEYVGNDGNKKYIANLDDVSTAVNNAKTKYYAVNGDAPIMSLADYSNAGNDGAKGEGSLAAGFVTHADGIASTVAGSYSGVINSGKAQGLDLRGAAALSYGTFNVNKNAAQAGTFSGVANSIVGQANVTTDSNAAIIYGAGNTVKNSYRDIDTKNASEIMAAAGSGDVTKLSEALQKAVPTSGGQVMVMGGGNSVENAYMTQVTGVGNTVTGSGEKYDKDSSTQLNYVDGFYTTLENGKNDYIIGSHNTVTGTSTDKNKSNIVFGDNHTLKNTKNNVILGSLDAVDETTVSDVVSIGHDAKVSAEGGVAIGSGSVVSENNIAGTIGYDPLGAEHKDDTTGTWKSTDGAVSVGGSSSDGKTITRQITNVAAGTNPTDVVNVAQLQNATEDLTNKGLKFKGDDNQEVTRKLNDTLTLKGGVTNTSDLSTAANIGVVKDGDGGLKIELAKNLTGLTSVTTGNTTIDNSGLTIKNDGDTTKNIVINSNNVSLGGNTITNMGSGADASGNYTNTANAANVGDVQNIVKKAVDAASDATNQALAGKANVDASNLTPDNVTKWQEKLGNGKVESGNTGLVTGDTVFKAVDTKANRDGSNLTDKEADSFSEKIARGEVKAGENRAVSGDAVSQAISKVTGDMNTKLDGKANTSLDNITDTGKNVIRDLAKGSVKVIDGTNTTVTTVEGKGEKPTTYAVNVEGKGTVTSGNTGLISGGTAYTELRPADGSYVKQNSTTAANLSALDSGLKATSDLIHTNTAGDTIQIGGSSSASKIDVNGKDGKGRVITGVVSDANDPTSAANVGYVNGVTAANTQQIYRDMNNAYGRLNNNINKAAAGSNALAALHPLDYDPDDKADFAVGYGHYRNANAAAVGAFYHPNENTMVNVGVSLGNGDPGFNAGVSFKVGRGGAGREAMSKTEMAKVINSQSKEIDALKKDNADKDKRIDALEQKMAEILAKLDKNGK